MAACSIAVGAPEFEASAQLWQLTEDASGNVEANFIAELKGHTKNVNAVRFSPDGTSHRGACSSLQTHMCAFAQGPSWLLRVMVC